MITEIHCACNCGIDAWFRSDGSGRVMAPYLMAQRAGWRQTGDRRRDRWICPGCYAKEHGINDELLQRQ